MLRIFTVFTNNGTPQTGLSPTIDIRTANGTLVINNATMTEVGGGGYRYDFTSYNGGIDYLFVADGGSTLSDSDRYQYGSNEFASVWDEEKSEHTNSGTFGESVNTIEANTERLRDIEEGNWRIIGTQMIFYDRSNAEIFRFNLFDSSDSPSSDEVFSRVKV